MRTRLLLRLQRMGSKNAPVVALTATEAPVQARVLTLETLPAPSTRTSPRACDDAIQLRRMMQHTRTQLEQRALR